MQVSLNKYGEIFVEAPGLGVLVSMFNIKSLSYIKQIG